MCAVHADVDRLPTFAAVEAIADVTQHAESAGLVQAVIILTVRGQSDESVRWTATSRVVTATVLI